MIEGSVAMLVDRTGRETIRFPTIANGIYYVFSRSERAHIPEYRTCRCP